jgi:hypothetical protein
VASLCNRLPAMDTGEFKEEFVQVGTVARSRSGVTVGEVGFRGDKFCRNNCLEWANGLLLRAVPAGQEGWAVWSVSGPRDEGMSSRRKCPRKSRALSLVGSRS